MGTHPTDSETGFGEVTLDGANYPGGAVAEQAKTDLATAFNVAAGRGPTVDVETELGGLTLTPGVYGNETLGITGTLTLNTLGDPNAVFIFQADSTLITASASRVIVLGGGTACNVFWQIGSSATLGTNSDLIGTVMASAAITAATGAEIEGRLLAQTESVTLHTNTITRPTCSAPGGTDGADTGPGGTDAATDGTDTGPGGTDAATDGADTGPGGTDAATDGTDAGTSDARSDGTSGTSDGRSTSTSSGRPDLPATGTNQDLTVAGGLTLAVGGALLGLSKVRNTRARPLSGHTKPGGRSTL